MRTVSFGPSTRKLPVPADTAFSKNINATEWNYLSSLLFIHAGCISISEPLEDEECHSAYWELVPTIDHIIPIAIGGEDNLSNYATTSMLHNSVKSNWTLEQLNWKLYPAGDINEYDGLTDLFVKLTENDLELFDDPYIKRWYKLSVGMK